MLPEILHGLGHAIDGAVNPPFSGTHYSKEPIKGNVLHGDKRGMTGEGEEAERVYLPPRGAPAAIHVYEDNGQVFGKHPQILARPHAYKVTGNYNLANIDESPEWEQGKNEGKQLALSNGADEGMAESVGRNEAEWKLHESGYDGYRSKNSPGSVVLFGNHPAKSVDKVEKEKADLQATGKGVSQSLDESNLPNSNQAQATPVVSSPSQLKYPMENVDQHEQFANSSDPANLSLPYQKLFGIIPRNSNEHEQLMQASSQV